MNEEKRLKALDDYDIRDSGNEHDFDDLTRLAASVAKAPLSMINLIYEKEQWSKSIYGAKDAPKESPRNLSVCQYTVQSDSVFEVPDLSSDPRFKNFSYVKGEPYLRYYIGAPLITPEKEVLGALCVLDYKPRKASKETKEQLRIIADQVMAHFNLHKQNRELQSLNRHQTNLMKVLSHDLRSPLTGIVGFSELLYDRIDAANSDTRDLVNIICQSATQLNGMIDDILDYTIIQSKGYTFEPGQVSAESVTETMKNLYKASARYKQVELELTHDIPGDSFYADEQKFEQIYGNLLSNAIKFTPEQGTVRGHLEKKNKSIALTVSDTGSGIDRENIRLILNGDAGRLHRNKGTSGERSTGLGLQIIRYFTDLHDGRIEVDSRLNKGSTFTVTIPQPNT